MKGYLGRIGNWFSPRFLAWLRAFLLFFVIYTVFAVLLQIGRASCRERV